MKVSCCTSGSSWQHCLKIPRDELALGNLPENTATWPGAEVSHKLRTQNKNHLGPSSPGAQVTWSIFQEDSSILLPLGNKVLPVLLLVFSFGQRCAKARVVLTPPLHFSGSFEGQSFISPCMLSEREKDHPWVLVIVWDKKRLGNSDMCGSISMRIKHQCT